MAVDSDNDNWPLAGFVHHAFELEYRGQGTQVLVTQLQGAAVASEEHHCVAEPCQPLSICAHILTAPPLVSLTPRSYRCRHSFIITTRS